MTGNSFSASPIKDLYASLATSIRGLSPALAEKRMKDQTGSFKKESRYKREIKLFIRQFTSPLVVLLVIAVILSASLGESSDSVIILIILLTTGIFGFIQEASAGRAMEELSSMIEMRHRVLRDNCEVQLTTREIVPGDIILLEAGDIIPADCRIIESNELHVNESAVTGESFPAEKMPGLVEDTAAVSKKNNCLWQGTNVISGTATVLAIHTGTQTIFGQMAHSLAKAPETAFEKGIKRFGYFLLRITVILSLIILVANLYFERPLFEAVLFSLALAVGMTPELLPAIMTFAMSAGAKRMLKKRVIVKKLTSIFNFGEVNLLCTDKTGTITEGKITVRNMVDAAGNAGDRIRLYAYLNASLQQGFSNPIDQAIASLQLNTDCYEKFDEIPYDFIRKRLTIAVKKEASRLFITKGAFSSILEVCTEVELQQGERMVIDEAFRTKLMNSFVNFCQQGFRVLGISYKYTTAERITRQDEHHMIFLGFIILEDPLKQSSPGSIQRLKQLGINIKIITGDNRFAAAHTAKMIGIDSPVILTGEEIADLNPEAIVVRTKNTDIFAEIDPQQKELIIKALQKSNFTVAYIGDGINDVAAINAADIGISADNAVDVAKEAADFVLLEKDLSVLADGVYEGRRSFSNSMKYILINTGAIFGNMFSMAGASLILPFLPMLPKQILLTNLLSDLPYLTIASDQVDDGQLTKPGKWDLKMIRNFMIVFGLHSSLFDLITFYTLVYYFHLTEAAFQTGWFIESVITELLILYVIRTRKPLVRSKPGRLVLVTSMISFIITILLPVLPVAGVLGLSKLDLKLVMTITLIMLLYVFTADLLKMIFFRFNERRQHKDAALINRK
ncbi:MAG: magnesium-translocating P-type ATPase [Citrobacter freundii]|nr:MAG: magnesium-translocating P-type ATPase [Citrobacter freundii]